MKTTHIDQLTLLTKNHFGESPENIQALPGSGSYREYYRINFIKHPSIMGVFNEDVTENNAFLGFSETFIKTGISVPEIFAVSANRRYYLIQDLGDEMLYDRITKNRTKDGLSLKVKTDIKSALTGLIQLQTKAGAEIDYNLCYPRSAFDKQSILWDLWYFKYYFLKVFQIPFNEQKLEDDFHRLTDYLLSADCNYFLFRDFQSRNIMMYENKPYFIDYQGGRKGALQYDLSSILFDAKANFRTQEREEFYHHYVNKLSEQTKIDEKEFRSYYFGYALIRILQAMGAYGFRGIIEQKPHFILSIPFGIKNLKWILENHQLPIDLPELFQALENLIHKDPVKEFVPEPQKLTVSISSFSFKKGIPLDESGNGGGYVFDCRGLNNPGRIERYKKSTGQEKDVIEFLQNQPDTSQFIDHIFNLINISIKDYTKKGRAHLSINFGCTGGQHRSVYCSEQIAKRLESISGVKTMLRHREIEKGLF